jgi:hypothetical protein
MRRAASKQVPPAQIASKQVPPAQIASNLRRFIGRHVAVVNRRINRNQAAVLAAFGAEASVLDQYVSLGSQLGQVETSVQAQASSQ